MGRQLRRPPVDAIEPRQRFLIVCEGSKTEPNYFKQFRVSTTPEIIELNIVGAGSNTISVIETAIKNRNERKLKKEPPYDQIWCVFDRDSFPAQRFNEALALAQREKIRVAYSNEAFELWYLLHFDYHQSGIPRASYIEMLNQKERLDGQYKKNSTDIYEKLLPKQATAIKNAEKLLQYYTPSSPEQDNPSTTVHLLVKELNRFIP